MATSLRKDKAGTLGRIHNWISKDRYVDVPNIYGRLYPDTYQLKGLGHWAVPGGVGEWMQYSFEQVTQQDFQPAKVGDNFGRTWSTHWFKLELDVPLDWVGKEVRLRWDSSSEAMLYSKQGKVLQGFTSMSGLRRSDFIVSLDYQGDGPFTFYVEMACNHIFGGGSGSFGDIEPPDPDRTFTLSLAEIATFDRRMYKLLMDLEVLLNMAEHIPEDNPRCFDALYRANHMVTLHIEGQDEEARDLANKFFSEKNGEGTHTIGLIGNCHIDSAWLWPCFETIRKAARSFSSQLRLMDIYDDYTFVASQAQQYEWIKDFYPALFEEIKSMVAKGRFIPCGGVWVEMDGNIPSGESFIRQFLFGQRFFQSEFGFTCKEFWLPDTFGYSANIPHILQHVSISRFLTQKLSWNFYNKFPHQSFVWEGIDGSSILAHFPPGDSYELKVRPSEALFTVKNLRDKGRTRMSAMLYGFGDGGGGPHEDMLERAKRLEDVNGIPKMKKVKPDELFESLEEDRKNLMRWTGELYLELHNGTFTTQAEIKRLNRRCEMRLHDAELLLTTAFSKCPENKQRNLQNQCVLNSAWKKVLLNQFHDILPGSCIHLVAEDAHRSYNEALDNIQQVHDDCWTQLFGDNGKQIVLVNSLCWERREVSTVSKEAASILDAQQCAIQYTDEEALALLKVSPMGYSVPEAVKQEHFVSVRKEKDTVVLNNGLLEAVINKCGHVCSLKLAGNSKEAVARNTSTPFGCNQFLLFSDMPPYWDAWDISSYHLESKSFINHPEAPGLSALAVEAEGPLAAIFSWKVNVGKQSCLRQKIVLRAHSPYLEFETEVDWKENRKVLKVGFGFDILAREADYDIQFGNVSRKTNTNTSWDWAKYEVCGHKWADMSENNFGISVLNDSKYGWSAVGSDLTLSLLKASKKPDEHADMRVHQFKYALLPHQGSFREAETIKRSYEFNSPILYGSADASKLKPKQSWFNIDSDSVILDTVKPAEDSAEGACVLRLFESFGRSTTALVFVNVPVKRVWLCGGMENKVSEMEVDRQHDQTSFLLQFRPYQLASVLVEYKL